MIDLASEEILTLKDACALFPKRRRGKRPAFQTLLRWALKGVGGRRLEVLKVGSCLCTSHQAVERFVLGLTGDDPRLASAGPPIRTSRQREREIAAADEHLRREGVLE